MSPASITFFPGFIMLSLSRSKMGKNVFVFSVRYFPVFFFLMCLMTYFPSKHTPQNRTTSKVPQKDLDVLQMLTLLHLSHWLEWEHPVLCRYTSCPHCNQKAGLIITDADPLTHEPTLMHRLRFVSLTDPPQSGGRRGRRGDGGGGGSCSGGSWWTWSSILLLLLLCGHYSLRT